MSLFPAYAPPGSSKQGNQSNSKGKESGETPLYHIDKQGDTPDVITIDSVDSSDGELPSSSEERPSHSKEAKVKDQVQNSRSRSGSKDKKKNSHKKHEREKSKSRSKSKHKKRRRSRSPSVEEVSSSHSSHSHRYDKKKDKRSRRDDSRDRNERRNDRDNYNSNYRDNRPNDRFDNQYGYGDMGRGGRGNDRGQYNNNYNNNNNRGGYNNYQDQYQHQQQRGGPSQRISRDSRGGQQHTYHEEQRLNIAQRFPRKVFLEEVNLHPEYAFRVDKEATPRNLNFYTLGKMQKSFYDFNNGKVIGATNEELTQIYSKFSKYRCVLPGGIDDDGNPIKEEQDSGDDSNSNSNAEEKLKKKTPVNPYGKSGERPTDTLTFISFDKSKGEKDKRRDSPDGRVDLRSGFESLSFPRKEGELNMKQQIEQFNKRVRAEPQNIALWKEFVDFQDKVFQESEQIFDYAEDGEGSQHGTKKPKKQKGWKKRNKKALVEKKTAIIEKALQSNPRNMELQFLRLDLLYQAYSPNHVLAEWKKLVAKNQQVTAFWVEYLRFSSCQLQLYSSTAVTSTFDKCFQKFRQMIGPSYPDFQRPKKFPLVMADLLFALCLMLKNAGYREKAIALHQAQLELDFYPPIELFKDKTLVEWDEDKKLFEMFWDIGTPKFGEPEATGWVNLGQNTGKSDKKFAVGVSEAKTSEFEDLFFETLTEEQKDKSEEESRDVKMQKHWLTIESTRSKLQWVPWRANCSDVDDIEDGQRVVLGVDVTQLVYPVPVVPYINDFDRQATYFRHLVNFILTIQEDFLPQSQTLDTVLSPFTSVSLTESRSLFSQVFYWRKLLNLYIPEGSQLSSGPTPQPSADDETSKPVKSAKTVPTTATEFKTPEGFRVLDLTTGGTNALSSANKNSKADCSCKIGLVKYTDEVEELKAGLLKENHINHVKMLRNLVEKGVDVLDQPFGTLLFEMYLRFEQKNTYSTEESRKVRMKVAKNLMQKEKLRNEMGCYREMAMLEYFEGNAKNAMCLLVKTINLGVTTLEVDEAENVNLDLNWERILQLTTLYLKLAELNLVENPTMAYEILLQLGNGFKPVREQSNPETEDVTKIKTKMLKALRFFEKIFDQLLPGVNEENKVEEESAVTVELSNETLGRWDGEKGVEFLLQKPNLIVEWTRAFALFQYFAKDFEAASQVYVKAMKMVKVQEKLGRTVSYDSDLINRQNIREQLYVSWCNLGAFMLSKDPMGNAKFRNILGKALEEFPSSPPLLLLFTDVEKQMSIAGKLWRMMVGLVKEDGGCNHWAPLIMGLALSKKIEDLEHDEEIGLDTFGLGGPAVPPDTIFYKLDALLTAAQQNSLTRNCGLIWRVHLKLLALRAKVGKDVQRSKATFYDAVRHCPSIKALYLDGITYFPEMFSEITDLMVEKQLYIRLPVEELQLLLEIEGEEIPKKKTTENTNSSDVSDDGEV